MLKPLFYLTDDRDKPQDEQRQLVIMSGGNGDWYVGTADANGRDLQTARICTSGGASTYCPGLGIAIAEAYRAMQAGVKGEHRPYVAPRAELEEELLAWRAKFNNLSYQFGELTTAPV